MIIYKLVFSPVQVNTYILADQDADCAIIDCGCYNEIEFESLVRFLEEKKLNPVLLLNTHCHLDHIFGNSFMYKKYNLLTKACKDDEMNRLDAVAHASLYGLYMDTPPEVAEFIADNQNLVFGNTSLRSIYVPGHTAGSIAFYSESDGCVFTGDALFEGSIGRTDFPGGDYDTLIRSITTRLFTLPPETRVYPGHGSETTISREKNTNPFFKKQ
jgi:hydroxyacylglutathione hydrolase